MSVLIKKTNEPDRGFPIGVVLNRKETKGEVGIEVEVEGKRLPHNIIPLNYKFWKYEVDHSLRGEENGEYILKAPIAFDLVDTALAELWKSFTECKSRIDDSNRTSVHVHLNVQRFHLNRLTSFFALFYCLEELLTEWCGEHRVGNLFCLRAKDAPSVISTLKRFIKTDCQSELRDSLHYAACNFHALNKYGSVEIRTLRGPTGLNSTMISEWVQILRRIYDLSAEFPDPREICQEFSAMGPMGFFEKIMGNCVPLIRATVPWSDEEIGSSMLEGIRLAQDLCYCRDWGIYEGIEMKPDPFGRKAAKIAQKLQNYTTQDILNHWTQVQPQAGLPPITVHPWNHDPFAPQQAPVQAYQTYQATADFEPEDNF